MIILNDPQKLKEFILKDGHTVSSFSDKIGVAPATLTIVFQKKRVSPRTAKLICDALHIDFDRVFKIKED